jgi:hypothetical protein
MFRIRALFEAVMRPVRADVRCWRAETRYWRARDVIGMRLALLVVEEFPERRANLLSEVADALRECGETYDDAFRKKAEPGVGDGERTEARLMDLLVEAEWARAAGRRRWPSDWTRVEAAAGRQLERLAEADMADAGEQAAAYRALWAAVVPHLVGPQAGGTLLTIEHGSRMRATAQRVALELAMREAAA